MKTIMKTINKPFNGKQLAKDIISKRETGNISVAKAVDEIGINSNATLHRAELGEAVGVDSLYKICNWLGKPVQAYFSFLLVFICLALFSCSKDEPQQDPNKLLTKTAKAVNGPTVLKGAKNTLKIDFSSIGSNAASITFNDVNTGEAFTVYSSNGLLQDFDVPKNDQFTVYLTMSNNEPTEISYWLDWQNVNEGIGLTLQAYETSTVGEVFPCDFQKNAVVTLIRR